MLQNAKWAAQWNAGRPVLIARIRFCSPNLQLEIPVLVNQLEVGAIRSDEFGPVASRGQRDQYIEVKIAQLARFESLFFAHLRKQHTRLQPIVSGWSQYGVVLFECMQNVPVNRRDSSPPEFCEN